jgi:hypothetical protein
VKYGASRHAATAKRRSSVSPSLRAMRGCWTAQVPQPLIWLARRETSVFGGRPVLAIDFDRACSAASASGMTNARLLMRACSVGVSVVVRVCTVRPPSRSFTGLSP